MYSNPKSTATERSELRSLRKALADTPRTSDAAAGKGRGYRYGRQPRRHRRRRSAFPLTPAATRPVPCVGIGRRRPDGAQRRWMACASAARLTLTAQPRGALARRRRSAVPCLRHLRRRRLQSLSPYPASGDTDSARRSSQISPKTSCSIRSSSVSTLLGGLFAPQLPLA